MMSERNGFDEYITRFGGGSGLWDDGAYIGGLGHDKKHHPELSAWFKSLADFHGTPCCDGSDATRIEDVDRKRSVRLAQANVTIRFA